MPYASKEKKAEYDRLYRLKRGEELLELKRLNSKEQHTERTNLLSCFTCISCVNADPTVVQWHHLDPSIKSFEIFKQGGISNDKFWDEVLKCVPLCANCHLKIHKNQLCLLPIKGK